MSWSWKIATVRGIGVYLHATFWLVVAWILFVYLATGQGLFAALQGVAVVLLLFLCVVLHEFGHALAAQRYGIQTRDITLYPIGGVARLERIPRNPSQELVIALAGPAVNVLIAGGLALILLATKAFDGTEQLVSGEGNVLRKLFWMNLLIVGFNMLPAFPMDGGRVLRALMAQRMEYGRATQLASTVGQGMAFLMGLYGLFGPSPQPMLLFIAFFVYVGAGQEAAMVETELAFRGIPVREAMVHRFRTLAVTDSLAIATQQLLAGSQLDFPVTEGERLVGVLTRTRLIEGLSQQGLAATVGEAMLPSPPSTSPEQSLEETFQQMREAETSIMPVLDNGRLVGMLTLENIGEFLMVRNALQGTRRGRTLPVAARLAATQPAGEIVDAAAPGGYHAPRRRGLG